MSQELVERVRRGFDRFAETGEAGGPGLHPDLEVFDHDIPDARSPYRGAAGFNEWLSDFGAAWDRFDMEIERLIDAGDRVVSLFRLRAVGAEAERSSSEETASCGPFATTSSSASTTSTIKARPSKPSD